MYLRSHHKIVGLGKLNKLKHPDHDVSITRKLGGGSYGTVHRGVLKATGEAVAVKVIELPDLEERPGEMGEMGNFALELELLELYSGTQPPSVHPLSPFSVLLHQARPQFPSHFNPHSTSARPSPGCRA